MIGTNHCGNTHRESFKRCSTKQYVLCCRDYAERVVAIFAQKIQSEYYGEDRSVSIKGILLENFSSPTQTEISGKPQECTHNYVFHSFLSYDRKQYAATTISNIKHIIELLKQRNIMSNMLSKIW